MKSTRRVALLAAVATWATAQAQSTQVQATSAPTRADSSATRQSREDAWWTGPILAANAGTLPQGHALIEPYVFNSISRGRYDDNGHRQPGAQRHSWGSLTYINYGLFDRFTVGLIPRFGYHEIDGARDSSGIRVGDATVQAQYRFTQFEEGRRVPTFSLNIGESLPTGKYDNLGDHPSDGIGGGTYTTLVSLYSQYFLWMPNGRIVRTRLNLAYSLPGSADVDNVSVYGTAEGFHGTARPGRVFTVDSAWEYSMTRSWVLALDIQYEHDASTRVRGFMPATDVISPPTAPLGSPVRVDVRSGASELYTLAPAIEYNWSPTMGVIAGAVISVGGRNAGASTIPVMAINMVF